MTVSLGSTTINKLMLGSTETTKVYLGSTLLHETSSGAASHGPTLWDQSLSDADFWATVTNGGRDAGPTGSPGVVQPDLPSTAKIYFELEQISYVTNWSTSANIGLISANTALTINKNAIANEGGGVIRPEDGGITYNTGMGTSTVDWGFGSGWPLSNGEYVMFAVDTGAGLIWYGHSTGGWYGDPAAGTGGFSITNGPWRIYAKPDTGGALRLNTSTAQLQGSVPSGFSALDT